MSGLLLKDLFNLKKYVKQIGLTLVLFVGMGVYMKSPSYVMGMMVMMSSMMTITSMSYDEYAKWDKYALTMPVIKKDIVLAKYLLLVVTCGIGAVISLFVGIIMDVAMHLNSLKDQLLACGVVLLIALLFYSILLPFLFKYGVEKARLIMFAVFGIPAALAVGFGKLMQTLHIPLPTKDQLEMALYAFPVVVLIIVFVSYNLSVSIFNKKEL